MSQWQLSISCMGIGTWTGQLEVSVPKRSILKCKCIVFMAFMHSNLVQPQSQNMVVILINLQFSCQKNTNEGLHVNASPYWLNVTCGTWTCCHLRSWWPASSPTVNSLFQINLVIYHIYCKIVKLTWWTWCFIILLLLLFLILLKRELQ